ncbi:aa3-type cytochrome c oxidase subunit IV [Paracoccus aerodenitrificans]|nr:aa3-type cytochrome c oxidase subunit IV [Paracoccus aerodenitrificans]WBU64010.1 aa3-type cytochrome c oxidase subunit IV [Paracoccus aerodenitrificans]
MTQNNVTEHEHGSMEIRDHQRTFAAFIRFATWVAGLAIVVLIFLALSNS